MPEPTLIAPAQRGSEEDEFSTPQVSVEQLLVEDDLVIEEVSIDGMCGVY